MFAMLVRQYLLEENYSEEERRTVPLTLFCRRMDLYRIIFRTELVLMRLNQPLLPISKCYAGVCTAGSDV